MLLHASITDQFVNFATHLIHTLGYPGLFLMILMSALVFVPGTEAPTIFAGAAAYRHEFNIFFLIVAGVAGDVLGAVITYWIGRKGLHVALQKIPGLHLDDAKLDRASRWFEKYGSAAALLTRLIPMVRAAGPYAAGISEMPFGRFTAFTTVGATIWISFLAIVGDAFGASYPTIKANLKYVDYTVAVLLILALLYLGFRLGRGRKNRAVA